LLKAIAKDKKPIPLSRIGFNLNQSFGYPHPGYPTIPKREQINNLPNADCGVWIVECRYIQKPFNPTYPMRNVECGLLNVNT
jgi:hypothetical protein